MEFNEFKSTVDDIYSFFRYENRMTAQTLQIWFEEIKNIPAVAIPTILRQFHNCDNMPRNIVKMFRLGWSIYRKENPQKIAHGIVLENCPVCKHQTNQGYPGTVVIEYADRNGLKPTALAKCGACANYKNSGLGQAVLDSIIFVTPEMAEKQGWRLLNQLGKESQGKRRLKDPPHLIEIVKISASEGLKNRI